MGSVPTAAQSKSALYAPACFSYCTSLSARFWNTAVLGAPRKELGLLPEKAQPMSLETAVNLWFFKGAVRG